MTTEILQKFIIYDQQNPHVYTMFRNYARQAKDRGYTKFSAKAIFERLRWHFAMETVGDDFKLNNNYTAHYARKMMAEEPGFMGFFELRERKI
jgi:hypothetical protein